MKYQAVINRIEWDSDDLSQAELIVEFPNGTTAKLKIQLAEEKENVKVAGRVHSKKKRASASYLGKETGA